LQKLSGLLFLAQPVYDSYRFVEQQSTTYKVGFYPGNMQQRLAIEEESK